MSKNNIEISVIIAAHNRKRYLKEAISSALNQDFDRDKYEIIVVKNFEDKEIDSFIEEKNVKSLYTEEEKLGGKVKLGIEESKGQIVCFLDDDKFHEGKLRRVHSYFMTYKDLSFYHNNRIVIDEAGRVLLTPKTWEEEYISQYDEKVYASLIRRRVWANNSSICVRKNDIELRQLGQIDLLVDLYLISSVLINRKPLLLDHTPLTYYRVHDSNTSLVFRDINQECVYRRRNVADLSKIYEWSKDNREFAHVFYYLYFILTKWNYGIICEDKRLEVLLDSLKMLRSPFITLKSKVKYVGASSLNLFFHSFVKNYLINPRSQQTVRLPKEIIDIKETEIF